MIAKRNPFWTATALLALWIVPSQGAGQRTDVLTISNGNVITGEVRELDQGYLSYKTDNAGTLSVKWLHVTNLRSVHDFEVELTSGMLLNGSLDDPAPGRLAVAGRVVGIAEVVSITPIKSTFWARTSGHISVGLNLSRADNRYSGSIDGEFMYRSRRWGGATGVQFYEQNQEDANRFRRASVSLDGFRYFGPVLARRKVPVWAGRIFWKASTNDQLSLDLRNEVGIGAQRRIWRTNQAAVTASLGVLESRETYADEEDPFHSVEAVLVADLDIFRLDSPKLNVSVTPEAYFGLSSNGRVRGTLDARVKYELFGDFFIGLTGHLALDNKPQSSTASKSDYTLSFTVGYSWW
jgi:hypothetical protein